MNNKQFRIDFPDYPAKEQERDASKLKINEIYLSKVNGEWGAIMLRKYGTVVFNAGKTPFAKFVKGIIEDYPEHKLRCVRNYGIDEKIAQQQKVEKMFMIRAGHSQER